MNSAATVRQVAPARMEWSLPSLHSGGVRFQSCSAKYPPCRSIQVARISAPRELVDNVVAVIVPTWSMMESGQDIRVELQSDQSSIRTSRSNRTDLGSMRMNANLACHL